MGIAEIAAIVFLGSVFVIALTAGAIADDVPVPVVFGIFGAELVAAIVISYLIWIS